MQTILENNLAHDFSSVAKEKMNAKYYRNLHVGNSIEEIQSRSLLSLSNTMQGPEPRKLRRAASAKDIIQWNDLLLSGEQPRTKRKNSDISFASVRSTCRTSRTLTGLLSGTESLRKNLFNIHYILTATATPSHGISMTEIGSNEIPSAELEVFKKRADDLAIELLETLQSHHSQFQQGLRAESTIHHGTKENANVTEKCKEALGCLLDPSGLGSIEWERKCENFKEELANVCSENTQCVQALQSFLLKLSHDVKSGVAVDPLTKSKMGKIGILVTELANLIVAKKNMIKRLDDEKNKYDNESKDLRLRLSEKDEELTLLRSRAEKLESEKKTKTALAQSNEEVVGTRKTEFENKTQSNLSLIQTHQREKQVLATNHQANITNIQLRKDALTKKSQAVDEALGKMAKKQHEIDNLQKELQANREQIAKLKEQGTNSRKSSEERISQEKARLSRSLSSLKDKHKAEFNNASHQIEMSRNQREKLQDLSVFETKSIRMLNTDAILLKHRINQLNKSFVTREESFKVETAQLKKKLDDLSQALKIKNSALAVNEETAQ